MEAIILSEKLVIEKTGTEADVPLCFLGRLMYYLSVVNSLLFDAISNKRYYEYDNWDSLNKDEKTAVVELGIIFNIDLLMKAGIIINDKRLVRKGSNNQFYRITDERIGIHINENIIINGRSIKILEVMACTDKWIEYNYTLPMNYFLNIDKSLKFYKLNPKNQHKIRKFFATNWIAIIQVIVILLILFGLIYLIFG